MKRLSLSLFLFIFTADMFCGVVYDDDGITERAKHSKPPRPIVIHPIRGIPYMTSHARSKQKKERVSEGAWKIYLDMAAEWYPYTNKDAFKDRFATQIRQGLARGISEDIYIEFLSNMRKEYKQLYRQEADHEYRKIEKIPHLRRVFQERLAIKKAGIATKEDYRAFIAYMQRAKKIYHSLHKEVDSQ